MNLIVAPRAFNRVVLSWQPTSNNTQGYHVERSINGRTWVTLGTLGADVTTFTDSSVGANRSYEYRVRAFDAWGKSPASQVVRVRTSKAVVRPVVKKNKLPARLRAAALPAPASHRPSVARASIALHWPAVDLVFASWQHPPLKRSNNGLKHTVPSPR
jgi:hypothetical protein